MRYIICMLLSLLLFLPACIKPEGPNLKVMGMKPVYVAAKDFYDIRNIDRQPLHNTGTIYIWRNYFLVIEYGKGIHVYDRTDVAHPVYLSFLNIPGCVDFTIAQETLFADNGFDILSVDIRNILEIKLNTVLKNATKNSRDVPPGYKGYFECHDPSKGYYIGWDSTLLNNPHCHI